MEIQIIEITGSDIIINNVQHILNTDFCEKVDDTSIHISLDSNMNIRLFECAYTIVNGASYITAEELANSLGLTIDYL